MPAAVGAGDLDRGDADGTDRGEQPGRRGGSKADCPAAGTRSRSSACSWLTSLVRCGDVVAVLIQQRQQRRQVLRGYRPGLAAQRSRTHRGGRVDSIGLAAPAARQFPDPRCRGRGHIIYSLAAGDQSLGQVPVQATRILRTPAPLATPGRPSHQSAGNQATTHPPSAPRSRHASRAAGRWRYACALTWIDPDDHHAADLSSDGQGMESRRRHTDFQLRQTISPLLGQAAAMTPAGSANPEKPTQRRHAVHEPGQPASRWNARSTSPTIPRLHSIGGSETPRHPHLGKPFHATEEPSFAIIQDLDPDLSQGEPQSAAGARGCLFD